jgi:general secretion pathway protein C
MQAWLSRARNRGPRLVVGHGPRWVSLLLAAIIVLDGARLVLPLLDARASVPTPKGGSAPPYRSRSVDAQSIVERHLFGVAEDDSESDPAHPSISAANLVLQGTLAAKDPRRGVAIITADGSAQVYKVGDDIGGATLHSVYLDRVVLDRRGRYESLGLPRLLSANGEVATHPRVSSADDTPAPNRGTPKSIGELMQLDASTNEDSGALQGFRLHPGRTGAAFIRAGLRPGDVMTAVNGTPLADQDQQQSQNVVNAMLTSDHATVSVLRNGKPVEISLDLGR